MAGLLRDVKAPQRQQISMAFKILDTAGTPTLSIGSQDGTITDNGVGDYTVTFARAFEREPVVMATPMENGRMCNIFTVSASSVRLKSWQADGTTAEDASLAVLVTGWYAADET